MYLRSIAAVALTALALLAAGCQARGEGSGPGGGQQAGPGAPPTQQPSTSTEPFSFGRDAFPTRVGPHYFLDWTDIQDGKVVPSRTEEYTIKRVEGDLVEWESAFTAGKTVSRMKYYGILRPDAIYMKLEEPALEAGGQHSTLGASLMFKFPLRPGLSWDYLTPKGTQASRRIVGLETITVKAGTFKAVRIAEQRETGAGTLWFVPKIGVIKQEINADDGQHTKELTRYVPAK